MSRRTNQELREDYLQWLEPQLRGEYDNNGKSYWGLVNLMFDTPFTWSDPMDENRLVDGLDLRVEFAHETNIRPKTMENLGPGSFLEVLVGLSRRLAFIAGGNSPGWSWQLLQNLELHRMADPLTKPKQRKSEEIMRVAMERTYLPDGTGGFFPLAWPDGDQTRVELWYQMNAFVEELHPGH
jgi:hypothetical protein